MNMKLCIILLIGLVLLCAAPVAAANFSFSDQTVSGTALPQKLSIYSYNGTYIGTYNSTDTVALEDNESYYITIKANAVNYLSSPENLFASLKEGVQTNIVWIVLVLGACLFVIGRR